MPTIRTFPDIFIYLEQLGVRDSILPFFLIFILVFATLKKTKIIAQGSTSINRMLSLILALMTIIPHITGDYPANADPITIINNA
ncbi:hypothetical protein COY95_04925, partial [Candidatus Woesearchaeota archaeon CG_4_10_14_0_8_um_filter_47_5]